MNAILLVGLAPFLVLADTEPEKAVDVASASEMIIEKTNEFRKENNLPALETNAALARTAKAFAQFMAENEKYGHHADGQTPAERAKSAGYAYCIVRENIAYRTDPTELDAAKLSECFTQGWIDSPGHRENMLADFITQTAVAIATTDGRTFYAVQLFGRPESMAYRFTLTNNTEKTWSVAIESSGGSDEMDVPPRGSLRSKRCLPITLVIPETDAKTRIKTTTKLTIIMKDNKPVFSEKK